jgi:hypothetical protein
MGLEGDVAAKADEFDAVDFEWGGRLRSYPHLHCWWRAAAVLAEGVTAARGYKRRITLL